MNDWASLAIVISAFGGFFGVLLRFMAKKDDRMEAAVNYIVDKHAVALGKLGDESAERSQSMEDCIRQSHELTGKAIVTMDRATAATEKIVETLKEHRDILHEFQRQNASRSGT